nr:hypothetical protein RKE32_00345 [Streptomyces sp. Li-HN-5-13]
MRSRFGAESQNSSPVSASWKFAADSPLARRSVRPRKYAVLQVFEKSTHPIHEGPRSVP